MSDNTTSDDESMNDQVEDMRYCTNCGEEQEEKELLSFVCMHTNELLYVCMQCLQYPSYVPEFIQQNYSELYGRSVVLAKNNLASSEDWQRAMVLNSDNEKQECEVEFFNLSPPLTQKVKFVDIQQIYTYDRYGDRVPLEKQITFSEYFGEDEEVSEFIQISDDLIPQDLTVSLQKNLDKIAEAPKKDFHPGSDGKVQNLFHPSLFCYVLGVSQLKDGTVEQFYPQTTATNFFGRENNLAQYQWLPSNFYINEDKKVQIQSYINGLTPREQYTELYKDLEAIFECFLPLFEKLLQELEIEERLVGRSLQVFVKAANYVLQPGQSHEGVWHVEGVSQEHILATGIYYYNVSANLIDSGLKFRRGISEDEDQFQIEQYDRQERPPPYDIDSDAIIESGTFETKEGRCIMFPNNYQHKLSQLSNKSEAQQAVRKMLCFFIVDPQERIVSTEEVNDQNWEVASIQIAQQLQEVLFQNIGQYLPEPVMQKIILNAKTGFSLEEAEANRLALMQHRKFYKDAMNREIERQVNLCEH